MSKFKKGKKGDLPAISTASLPDIVFMLLFFFMVATVLRDNELLVENTLPEATEVEKLKKDRTLTIYAGKPKKEGQGTESRIQINDAFISDLSSIKTAVYSHIDNITNVNLKDKIVVALKVDKEANTGVVTDIKEQLRKANALKVLYIAGPPRE